MSQRVYTCHRLGTPQRRPMSIHRGPRYNTRERLFIPYLARRSGLSKPRV